MDLFTKHGIDKLQLMVVFMPLLCCGDENDAKDSDKIDIHIDKIKLFLAENLKREITTREYINLLKGCRNYVISEPGTNERSASMKYLFELDFLTQ